MLRHSLYEPENPIVLYPPNQAPFIPDIMTHQSVYQYVPMLANLTANKITLKCRENIIRTYHYNECSFNNWQNPDFEEAVKLVADTLAVFLIDYPNTPFEQLVDKAVTETLVLLTSRKAYEFPEIVASINPMLKAAVDRNIPAYHRRRAEIDKLYDSIDPRPKTKAPLPPKPVVNPNEIYQQPYPEDNNMNMPNAYNINPRNAPGYNQPPAQPQPGMQHGMHPNAGYRQPGVQQPVMQHGMHSNQQYAHPAMMQGYNPHPGYPQPGMQPGMYPNPQYMGQPGYPNQQMYPGMGGYPQHAMQPAMHPNQQHAHPAMMQGYNPHTGYPQPGMYPNQQYPQTMPNGFMPGYDPQAIPMQPHTYFSRGQQGINPHYYRTNNFNAPQNGQTRAFPQANFNHTPAAQTQGLTGNLSGARFNESFQQSMQQPQQPQQSQQHQRFNQSGQNQNPLNQNAYFNPANQPYRRKPGMAHGAPEFANDFLNAGSKFKFEDDMMDIPPPPPRRRETPDLVINTHYDEEYSSEDDDDDDDVFVPNSAIETATKKEWRPSDSQPYLKMINPLTEYEVFKKVNGKVLQFVYALENPVKREQHTIKMLGDTYHLDGVISNKRMERLEASVENLLKISGTDVGNSEEKPDEKVTAEKFPEVDVKHYVDPGRIIDFFLDQALFEASLRFNEYNLEHKDNHTNVYRCFLAVNKPILSDDNYEGFIVELRRTKSFKELSTRILSIGKALYEKEKGISALPLINVLTNVNKTLTTMVNDCLRYELSLPEVSIDSFIEDVNDLPEFLEKTYSKKYREAFSEWERNIMQRLFVYHDRTEELTNRLLDEKQVELGIKVTFIPETYSATFISSTYEELGLEFGKKETLLLRKDSQKVLYKVAQSLFYQKDGGARDSVVDYVITADNVKLRIYRGYLGNEAYLVSKA